MESSSPRARGGLNLAGLTWQAAIGITVAAALVRLVVAAFTPLVPDEMYYWEWSRHLAFGYYDHPPMIAWLVRGGRWIAGETPLGVRLGPVAASLVAGLMIAASARRLAGDRAALAAAAAFAALPLSAGGLVLATPDAPLFAFAGMMLYAVIRALEAPAKSERALEWWTIGGVALGGAVSSKYTAVLLGVFLAAAMLLRRDLRPRLAEPGPYVGSAVALLVFSPVLAWNASREWASFAFQLQHGLGAAGGSVVLRELLFLGGQLGLVTPVLFVLICVACAASLGSAKAQRGALRVRRHEIAAALGIVALCVFLFFAYSASKRRAEPNWPALAYVPGLVLLGAYTGGRRWHRWLASGLALAATVTTVGYINAFTPILPVPAPRDPVAQAHGWNTLASEVDHQRARLEQGTRRAWIAGDRYQEAAGLAFHLPGRPATFALNLTTRSNQYDRWLGFAERAAVGDAMLLVAGDLGEDSDSQPTLCLLRQHFERVHVGEPVVLARDGRPVRRMRVWVLEGWRGTWP